MGELYSADESEKLEALDLAVRKWLKAVDAKLIDYEEFAAFIGQKSYRETDARWVVDIDQKWVMDIIHKINGPYGEAILKMLKLKNSDQFEEPLADQS